MKMFLQWSEQSRSAYRYVFEVLHKNEELIPFPNAKGRLVLSGKLDHSL
jgi:hypothetical protein